MHDSNGDRTLQRSVRRQQRRARSRAILAVLPALVFVLAIFAGPIIGVLYRAVDSGSVRERLPQLSQAITAWDGVDLPSEEVARALTADLLATGSAEIAETARELNSRLSGYRSLLIRTKRDIETRSDGSALVALAAIDPRWSQNDVWRALQNATGRFTAYYLLAALDLQRSGDGAIERVSEERRIYIDFILRTFWICGIVTICCVVIGYPIAYVAANASPAMEKLILFAVLLPFWTSVLVRTAAWVIILQNNGMLNGLMIRLGIISEPLTLVYNRLGVYIAMIHVLLPFMILPIHNVMKSIPKHLLPAAASLGARPFVTFRDVYLPLSMPGLVAGTLMTFILGLGYYVTPALVGGAGDQMQSGLIARFALDDANWPMASAIAIVLLGMTGIAYVILNRAARLVKLAV